MDPLWRARDRGDWRSVGQIAGERGDYNSLIEASRAAVSVGQITIARTWLERASAACSAKIDFHETRIESARLDILHFLSLEQALEQADAIERSEHWASTGLPVRLRWGIDQVRLMAGAYNTVPKEVLDDIEARFPQTESELRTHGELWQAGCVAIDRADKAAIDERLPLLKAAGQTLVADGFWGLAAQASLMEARHHAKYGPHSTCYQDALRTAEERFEFCEHVRGKLLVAKTRAEIALSTGFGTLDELTALAERFVEAGDPKNALAMLTDVSQEALVRGMQQVSDTSSSRLEELSEQSGLGIMCKLLPMRRADRAMRNGHFSLAKDYCNAALSDELPEILRLMLLTLRGSAKSCSGDRDGALADRSKAIQGYAAFDDGIYGSEIISALAWDIASDRTDDSIARSDELLSSWTKLDIASGRYAAAAEKTAQRSGIALLRLLADRSRGITSREEAVLKEAEKLICEAEAMITALPNSSKLAQQKPHVNVKRRLAVTEYRIQLLIFRGHLAEADQLMRQSIALLEKVELNFECANKRYLLGMQLSNRANSFHDQEFSALSAEAYDLIEGALDYYETVGGMGKQAVDAQWMLAKICVNRAARLVNSAERQEVINLAECHLSDAADAADALRVQFQDADRGTALAGKTNFSAEFARIYTDALRLFGFVAPDASKYYRWSSRSKACALSDLIGGGARPSPSLIADLANDPLALEMLESEQAIVQALGRAPATSRIELSSELSDLLVEMAKVPALAKYASFRSGVGSDVADLADTVLNDVTCPVFVDFSCVGDTLVLTVKRARNAPQMTVLRKGLSELERFAAVNLASSSHRLSMRDDHEILSDIAWLIEPLASLTEPGELLVICPTKGVGAIPLGAIPIDGSVLIVRNPISWTPSLSILAGCIDSNSVHGEAIRRASVFGDPTGDRPRARRTAKHLARTLGTSAVLADEATKTVVLQGLDEASLVHFHGHACFEGADPLESQLVLARGQTLTAREILTRSAIATRLLTLGACESSRVSVGDGDEPVGLMPVLLALGVDTILAAQHPVSDSATEKFMTEFYRALESQYPAHAARSAAVAMIEDDTCRTPYHWASFTIWGDPWQRPFKQECMKND